MRVAVIGHSSLNIAPAVAADLALRGFEVAWWPAPAVVAARGGLEVRQGELFDAGRSGFAPVAAPGSAAAALAGAEAVVVDIPAAELLPQVSAIAESLPRGVPVHLQSHGYWPASRLGAALSGRGMVFADSSAPTHAAAYAEGIVTAHARRRGLRFACVGGEALATLGLLYPDAQAAGNALETGLESINLMVHPGATLVNLAAFDRAAEAGTGFAFYGEGNTESAARLATALDAERGAVCTAWGCAGAACATPWWRCTARREARCAKRSPAARSTPVSAPCPRARRRAGRAPTCATRWRRSCAWLMRSRSRCRCTAPC